jgi:hypothetical protein
MLKCEALTVNCKLIRNEEQDRRLGNQRRK